MDALTRMVGGVTQMALNLTYDVWHALMCGDSGDHSRPLKRNALNLTYGGVTHVTHMVVSLLTWKLGHLMIYGCRRDVGANVSKLNSFRRLMHNASKGECRSRKGWPLIDRLVAVLMWGASEDGSVTLARRWSPCSWRCRCRRTHGK